MTDKLAYAIVPDVSQLLTPTEAADRLKVHPRTIRRWVSEGKLRSVALPSGRVRIPTEAIDELTGAAS